MGKHSSFYYGDYKVVDNEKGVLYRKEGRYYVWEKDERNYWEWFKEDEKREGFQTLEEAKVMFLLWTI